MRKLGLIAFANDGGLGSQTRRLADFLKPERILVIDSSGFSPNRQQHFEWYKDYNYFVCSGFPTNTDVEKFLVNLTHVFTVENPYNFYLVWLAQKQGTKVFCQTNYEFCDNLDKPYLPVPDKFLMPSYWKQGEMEFRFGKDRVQYLPPPINQFEFAKTRKTNMRRRGIKRFLHVIGTKATADRNGTMDLLASVKLSKSKFELVMRSQHPLSMDMFLDDPRVKYEVDNIKNNSDLYTGFDAVLLPRRWGGLSLGTCEGLMSGLPVIMTDISPNKELLPKDWVVKSEYKGTFMARSPIDFFSVDHQLYADKIDWLEGLTFNELSALKKQAFEIGEKNFGYKALEEQYKELWD